MADKISPGMQQYLDIKADYPDAFLLFRMGDFYELFYEDAVNAAQILELTLTSRNKNSENPIPMAGVPHHAVNEYIEKLINLGYRVALADQLEDPKTSKGVVKRGVTQVITPGTTVDTLTSNDNNFLVAFDRDKVSYGLSYIDLATGEFKTTTLEDFSRVTNEIAALKAKEVLVGFTLDAPMVQLLETQMHLLLSYHKEEGTPVKFDGLTSLESKVADKLLAYVHETQKRDLSHLQAPEHYALSQFLQMDSASRLALELTENKQDGKKYGSLFGLLDQTKTAMGTRLLKNWINRPLLDLAQINERQNIVASFLSHFFERSDLVEALKGVYDLERLASRISFGKALPVDLIQLAHSLENVPALKQLLEAMNDDVLLPLITGLDPITELVNLIRVAIDPNALRSITEGNIIKSGYNKQLDKYHEALTSGASWISDLEIKEREKTGITHLRIDYNRKDGYYFHITQSQLEMVPDYFFRKATLKNSERYGTKELSEIEEIMLEAREGGSKLEYDLFLGIREQVSPFIPRLQALAKTIAASDCFQSLATLAEKNQYTRPELSKDSRDVEIIQGKHPVIEDVLGSNDYIANDIRLSKTVDIQLITGPNMSGKSTYMRQFALLVILAQIGSYLPAESAKLPVFDALFTRIGASDNLIAGESTFMVEMSEANYALQRATEHSLILFDELGRGTATYDGMALAQGIIEYIHNHIHAKTLFATHYHELTALEATLPNLTNVHVATLEEDGDVVFLHKLADGPADKSYGIHVAKIAGLPDALLSRAETILSELEKSVPQKTHTKEEQLSLFTPNPASQRILDQLVKFDAASHTPIEALNFLDQLSKELKK